MAIIVEDGTAKTDANAFISVEWLQDYCTTRGHSTVAAGTTEALEAAIVRSTDYVSGAVTWAGYPIKPRSYPGGGQALAWPRSYVMDREGYSVADDIVPVEVMQATAEVAILEFTTPGAMAAVYTPVDRVKSEKVGTVAVEYDLSRTDAAAARPVLLRVRDLLRDFTAGLGSPYAGQSVRV